MNSKPNSVHKWLSDKTLITQNIDGLDRKAGNTSFIPIHGSIDKVTRFHDQNAVPELEDAPWEEIQTQFNKNDDTKYLKRLLLDAFKISAKTLSPEPKISLKPFVLLFDEYYSELYKVSEAEQMFNQAVNFVFMGTSFSVNITNMALQTALERGNINTPSSSQVVQPLYKSSIEKWKNYKKYFEDCHQYLEYWVSYFDYLIRI